MSAVTWDEFKAELLDLMGEHVVIDVMTGSTPVPVVGLEGVVVNASEGLLDGDPDRPVAVCLRIRSQSSPETERVESYFNIVEAEFLTAGWTDGKRQLNVRLRTVTALIQLGS
jgi:hypothetical protein